MFYIDFIFYNGLIMTLQEKKTERINEILKSIEFHVSQLSVSPEVSTLMIFSLTRELHSVIHYKELTFPDGGVIKELVK